MLSQQLRNKYGFKYLPCGCNTLVIEFKDFHSYLSSMRCHGETVKKRIRPAPHVIKANANLASSI